MTDVREDIINHSGASDIVYDGQPEWLKKRLEWFMRLRFGLIVHLAPCSQWDCCESWPLVPKDTWTRPDDVQCWIERDKDLDRFQRDYWKLNETFNPTDFDPELWADIASDAGFKYVCFTTKHHDGFCMFDTATTDYRITHPTCPYHTAARANIAREVFDAFRRKDMAISCYFSKSDWHSPHYWSPDAPPVDRHPNYDTRANPEQWARFVDFVHRQIEELMTGYGPIDVLWLDGGQVQPPNQDIQMDTIAGMARSHQPGLIIADRTVGGEHENFLTPEQLVPDESMHVPWETCMTLGNSWKYIPDDDYKSPVTVIRTLADIISKGGNFLLGIGPDSMGRFPGPAVACLREVGKWMKVNGEAIYDTQPIEPQASGSVRFTSRESDVYAIVLPDEEREAPAARVRVAGIAPAPGSELQLVGTPVAVPWTPTQDGFVIDLGNTVVEPAPAWVLRFSI